MLRVVISIVGNHAPLKLAPKDSRALPHVPRHRQAQRSRSVGVRFLAAGMVMGTKVSVIRASQRPSDRPVLSLRHCHVCLPSCRPFALSFALSRRAISICIIALLVRSIKSYMTMVVSGGQYIACCMLPSSMGTASTPRLWEASDNDR